MGHHRSHVKMPAAGSRQDRTRSNRRSRRSPRKDSVDKLLGALAEADTISVRQLAAWKGCEFIQLGEDPSGMATVGYRGWTKDEWNTIRRAVQAGDYEIRPAPQGGDVLVVPVIP